MGFGSTNRGWWWALDVLPMVENGLWKYSIGWRQSLEVRKRMKMGFGGALKNWGWVLAAIGSIQKAKNGLMKYYQGLNMDFGVPEGVEDLLK